MAYFSDSNFKLFELFFDLPHPSASQTCDSARVISPLPTQNSVAWDHMLAELYEPSQVSRVTLFAFPEYDDLVDATTPFSAFKAPNGAGLNKYDVYFHSFVPSYHMFSLQLKNGLRVHGHVRRYLAPQKQCLSRIDVGRRGIRAMVLLTRAPGGERFYISILKTLEGILHHEACVHRRITIEPMQQFLHSLQEKQMHLSQEFQNIRDASDAATFYDSEYLQAFSASGRSLTSSTMSAQVQPNAHQHDYITGVVIDGTEFGEDSPLISLDSIRFVLPQSLQPGYNCAYSVDDIDSPILPLLRSLGVSHTIRLLSALLCECRIIIVSASVTRLSACIRGVVSMLAQGLLVWQHLLIPVLPPHLLKCLTSDTPFVIGVLEAHINNIDKLPGLGEVLCIHLDRNTMETYHIDDPSSTIPDLLLPVRGAKTDKYISSCELLSQDLIEIVKADRLIWAEKTVFKNIIESGNANISTAAEPQTTKDKNNPKKEKSFFTKYTKDQNIDQSEDQAVLYGKIMRTLNESFSNVMKSEEEGPEISPEQTFNDAIYNESIDADSCENETAEEAARIAFTTFYLYLVGDMGMYLSECQDGSLICDRRKFLRCKLANGEKEHSPLFLVMKKFVYTLMFKQFVRARIREIEQPLHFKKKCIPQHRSLFATCEKFIRLNKLEWTLSNIRSVIQRISQFSIRRKTTVWAEEVRKITLSLISLQDFNADSLKDLAELIDHGCEVNGALCQIMALLWNKMQEGRPSMWKHPLLSLHIVRNLLLYGPISAITEVSDGINLIRILKSYVNTRSPDNGRPVRDAAAQVYNLLVDRAFLFDQRKQVACKRLNLGGVDPTQEPRWVDYVVRRLPVLVKFQNIHGLIRPKFDEDNQTQEKDYLDQEEQEDQMLENFGTQEERKQFEADVARHRASFSLQPGQYSQRSMDSMNELAYLVSDFNSTIPEDTDGDYQNQLQPVQQEHYSTYASSSESSISMDPAFR